MKASFKTKLMSNYDNKVLGTENPDHPANERDLTDREMLTEVYNVPKEVLEIFDRVADDLSHKVWQEKNRTKRLAECEAFLNQIKETLSASDNGMCIIVKNQIDEFLKK